MNEMPQIPELKPDVLIPYVENYNNLLPIALIYVRPRTNLLNYEKAILTAVQSFGDVIYLANINGKVFIKDSLIVEHYSTEYYFTVSGKQAIARFPEMVQEFEEYFKTSFSEAKIVGAFEASLLLGMTQVELFNTFAEEKDFKALYGQTIKRIKNCYVVNYDMPGIIQRYTPDSNVFVIAVQMRHDEIDFQELNREIFENLKSNIQTPIIDEGKYRQHEWQEKVKRTYHISKGHINAMFDMADFVFTPDFKHLKLDNIPFCKYIVEKNAMTADELKRLKHFNLAYIFQDDGSRKLISIKEAALGMNMEQICSLLRRVDRSSLWR